MKARFITYSIGATAFAAALALAPAAAPALSAGDDVTLAGCLVKAEGSGNPFLLTNTRSAPAMTRNGSGVAVPGGVGTAGEFRTIFYWLEGSGDLKDHIGHQVEISGDLKGDVKPGEIKLERKDNWTELQVKSDGRELKAQVPNQSMIGPEKEKGQVSVRRVDVDHIRMIAATCEP